MTRSLLRACALAVVAAGVVILSAARPAAAATYPAPNHVHAKGIGRHAIWLVWKAPGRARSFGMWRQGAHVANAFHRSYTFTGLACGADYQLGVRARYPGSHHSVTAWVRVGTASCTPPSVFLAPGGSDSAPCTSAQPCQTFDRAYHVAAAGQVVQVAAGTYPDQTINPPSKAADAAPVVFLPAPAASVSVGEVRPNGINAVDFRGMTFDDYYVAEGSHNIAFRGDSAGVFYIRSSSNVSVIGGSVGGVCDGQAATVGAAYLSSVPSSNILISGVRFHDITRSCNPTAHVECLFVQEVSGLTVQNSTFTNCDVMDVYFHRIGIPGNATHVVFKGNVLHPTGGGGFYAVLFRADSSETLDDYLIQNNNFMQDLYMEDAAGSSVSGFRFCGNSGSGQLKVETATPGLSRTC